MHLRIVLFLITTLIAQTAYSESLMASRNYILYGESGHGQAISWKWTSNSICQMGTDLQAVGFEMSQESLDAVIAGDAPASSLGILYGTDETIEVFEKLLADLLEINSLRTQLGVSPIKILGIDLPRPSLPGEEASEDELKAFAKASRDWMVNRDRFMKEQIIASGTKGLFHIGAAHAYTQSYRWPEEVSQQFFGLPESHSPAGKLLKDEHPKLNTASILIGSYTDLDKFGQFLPATWRPFWNFLNSFEQLDRNFIYSTSLPEIQQLETGYFKSDYEGLKPVSGFDSLAYLQADYDYLSGGCKAIEDLRARIETE
jgi:hypothetical protein